MKFGDIVGNGELKSFITQQIDNGRVPHAQIFEGKSGYQSLPFALAYAQYINCLSPVNGDSCGVCSSCIKSEALQHPDIAFIFPTSVPLGKKGKKDDYKSTDLMEEWRRVISESEPKATFSENRWYKISGIGGEKGNSQGAIGKAEAEYITSLVNYKPTEQGYRVIILWLPERMNSSSANALLKLFEEPAERNIFIFVSEQPQQILETILSRAQKITIPAIDANSILSYLKNISSRNENELTAIASASNGDILSAVSALKEEGKSQTLERFITLTQNSYSANVKSILEWVDDFLTLGREEQKEFFTEAVNIIRESFMLNVGANECSYSYGETHDFAQRFGRVVSKNNVADLVELFEKAAKDIQFNGNARIVITHFALTLTPVLRKK